MNLGGSFISGFLSGSEMLLEISMNGISVVAYILQALALYTIAKRRCIKKPGLAWAPFGQEWILGSVSDQYRYVVKGQVRNKRKVLLGLAIAYSALLIALLSTLIMLIFALSLSGYGFYDGGKTVSYMAFYDYSTTGMLGLDLALLILLVIPAVAVMIVYRVYSLMALWDLYCSCDPKNSKWMLVLSAVVSHIQCVFMMICKEKELGMPPRKDAIAAPKPETAKEAENIVEE